MTSIIKMEQYKISTFLSDSTASKVSGKKLGLLDHSDTYIV